MLPCAYFETEVPQILMWWVDAGQQLSTHTSWSKLQAWRPRVCYEGSELHSSQTQYTTFGYHLSKRCPSLIEELGAASLMTDEDINISGYLQQGKMRLEWEEKKKKVKYWKRKKKKSKKESKLA